MSRTYTKFVEEDQPHALLREVAALQRCKFHGVVKFVRAEMAKDGYYLTTVYSGSPLVNVFHKLPENKILSYISQILRVLSYCHSMGVHHRDIKPDNIVVENDDITIIDFGNARHKVGECSNDSIQTTGKLMTYIDYAAPEILRGDNTFLDKVDEWAVGVLLYNMITRQCFIHGNTSAEFVERRIKEGLQLEKYTQFKQLIDLCTGLLQINPAERLSVDAALQSLGIRPIRPNKLVRYNEMFAGGNSMNDKNRYKLFDWLEEVRDKFNFIYPTLDNTVRLVDNYTQMFNIDLELYQLLGCVCLHLSSYLFEVTPAVSTDYIYVTQNTYTLDQFYELQDKVIKVFNFDVDRM